MGQQRARAFLAAVKDELGYSEVSNLDNTNSPATRMNAGCAVVQITDF